MTQLFMVTASNPAMTPMEALRNLAQTAQANMNPTLQQAQGQRTPNMNGPSQFVSPSIAHMGLPGAQSSPHLGHSAHPSPAQNHLTGPGMIPPQNPGTVGPNGSQATSANTSPNVSNKRRRASTVKTEGEDGINAAEVNGAGSTSATKVKASPRVGGKRQKGTA
jgi:hypothetical protein